MSVLAENIVWHEHKITRAERAANKNQKPCLLWFTGLSGSGKSTIANALDVALLALALRRRLRLPLVRVRLGRHCAGLSPRVSGGFRERCHGVTLKHEFYIVQHCFHTWRTVRIFAQIGSDISYV